MDVLFICTANQCRSPMAEAMLRRRLEAAGVDAHVHSAGLLDGGAPVTSETLGVLQARGIDPTAHESRRITSDIIRQADLVIGLTRRHVIEAVVLVPEAWPRAFTLKELVRRAQDAGPKSPNQPLDDWLRKIAVGRTTSDMLGGSPLDDVADPVSEPDAITFEGAADEIERLIDRLVRFVWG